MSESDVGGGTKNPEIPVAKSLTDYIFRFLYCRNLKHLAKNSNKDRFHLLYKRGVKKMGRAFDIVNLQRAIRKLRLIT